MMDWPLLVPNILRRAGQFYPEKEIVSRWADGTPHRITYGELEVRVHRLMNALRMLGIRHGDRVATLAWNSHRHLELYFAVPSIGAVLHTINFRLSREQLRYIVNHAQDRLIFVDRSVAALATAMQPEWPGVERYVLMDDRCPAPPSLPSPAVDYEELMASASERAEFPALDEKTAAGMCYTSATTGDPKGVVYSHRSTFLHAMAGGLADAGGISEKEVALPAVPMFHVNAWGWPYACTMVGAKQVFPGSGLLGQPLAELLEAERVTVSAGVPTIWALLYQHLKEKTYDLSSLHTLLVGGSAASRAMIENFRRDFGIRVLHAWGMTETSPMGTISWLKREMLDWPDERQLDVRVKQGIPVPCVEVRILGENGEDLPWDGEHVGELAVRGPWVASSYNNNPEAGAAFTADGWFRTGDMANIDRYGYVQLSDRKKDLIKRKGEWISSVDMENCVLGHPGVLEAAVVARPDPVCDELPAVLIVRRNDPDHPVEPQDIIDLLARKFAKWQLPLPEDILFVEALPKTGVGKIDKKVLRKLVAEQTPRTAG
jgi:fatty-acyl-CoA synthase